MLDNAQRINDRKRAYRFIKREICNRVPRVPLDPTDTVLADVLGGTFGLKDALHGLREGMFDPSPKLVNAFKDLMKPLMQESTIDSYLVDPFR
jgi:hypothetical protein